MLPFVIDVEEAMAPDAPILHDDLFTTGVEPKPNKPSNIAKVVTFKKGDIEAGIHGGGGHCRGSLYDAAGASGLHRAACMSGDVRAGRPDTIHASSQGHFMIRAYTAKLLEIDMANFRSIRRRSAAASAGRP